MATLDMEIVSAVETELKLYMTQQLYRKGYLSEKMCTDATDLILKDAKKQKESKKHEVKH